MRPSRTWLAQGLVASFVLVLFVVPAVAAAAPTYPTTGVARNSIAQTRIGGYQGVLVNYTSTFTSSFDAFVYMDLTNAAGQTVGWNVGYCNFAPSASAKCFVAVPITLASGTYTAHVFAATSTGVAVSVESTVTVTI